MKAAASALALVVAAVFLAVALRAPAAGGGAVLLDIRDAIGPATSDYVRRGIEDAGTGGADLVILRMDTPGGLDTSMREIVRAILASPVPVVGFVAPSGAHAASAGTYILFACHVAAMAPGTNIGAATPVAIGGPGLPGLPEGGDKPGKDDGGEDGKGKAPPKPGLSEKAVSDAVAYIRSLAQMRGRNVEWAEKAVREAASLSAEDALAAGVIDLVAADVGALMTRLDGRVVTVKDEARTLATRGLAVTVTAPDWRTELLALITNPNVAYILMLLGIYGLLFEFYSPGLIGPGVVGAICLILALYAFHVLPVSYGGLALLLLGLALMITETVTPGFGALGLGGIVAFVIGSVMLFDTDVPGFAVAWPLIAGLALAAAAGFLLLFTLLMKARRRAVVSGSEALLASRGTVVDWRGRKGHVRVQGEVWQAIADHALRAGTAIRVKRLDGLTLVVEPEQPDGPPP